MSDGLGGMVRAEDDGRPPTAITSGHLKYPVGSVGALAPPNALKLANSHRRSPTMLPPSSMQLNTVSNHTDSPQVQSSPHPFPHLAPLPLFSSFSVLLFYPHYHHFTMPDASNLSKKVPLPHILSRSQSLQLSLFFPSRKPRPSYASLSLNLLPSHHYLSQLVQSALTSVTTITLLFPTHTT